jgi:hypothetical protein
MAREFTGRCACGGVTYVAKAEPLIMLRCHCRDCQRATGSAYAAVAVFPLGSVQVQGELRFHEMTGEDGDPIQRGFCPTCGSRIASKLSRFPTLFNLMAGTLDDPSSFKPTADVYTASAHAWDVIAPDTRRFARGMPRRP